MGIGTLAHTVGCLPLRALTERLAEYPIDFVQLALSKAISDIDLGVGKLSPALANHIAEQFDRKGIRIGVLGCYINPIHADEEMRRREIERFKEHIRFARDFGTSIVATETGDLEQFRQEIPTAHQSEAWRILKATVEELVEEAEKWGVWIGVEPVCVHTVSSPERMDELLAEIDSSHIGVVFDPCNMLTQQTFATRDEWIQSALRKLGHRIILAHLKDVRYRESGRLQFVRPGEGVFDIGSFLSELHKYKPFVDVSIEECTADDLDEAVRHVRECASAWSSF